MRASAWQRMWSSAALVLAGCALCAPGPSVLGASGAGSPVQVLAIGLDEFDKLRAEFRSELQIDLAKARVVPAEDLRRHEALNYRVVQESSTIAIASIVTKDPLLSVTDIPSGRISWFVGLIATKAPLTVSGHGKILVRGSYGLWLYGRDADPHGSALVVDRVSFSAPVSVDVALPAAVRIPKRRMPLRLIESGEEGVTLQIGAEGSVALNIETAER